MFEFWLILSAIAAGAAISIAGGGTLLTFPALVMVLAHERAANVTSTVALMPSATRFSLTSGVFPTRSTMLCAYFTFVRSVVCVSGRRRVGAAG